MASMTDITLSVHPVSPEAYLARYREFLARYSPAGWDLRDVAPAEAGLPEGPDEESERWWSATSNEEEVILDVALVDEEDLKRMYEAGRDGFPYL